MVGFFLRYHMGVLEFIVPFYPINTPEVVFFLHIQRFTLIPYKGPLIHVWSRSTNTISSVCVNTMGVVNTMSPCLYQDSMSIPQVLVYTKSPCLYQESLFIPGVHVYTINPCLYHESMSIPWVLANNKSPCPYYEPRQLKYR